MEEEKQLEELLINYGKEELITEWHEEDKYKYLLEKIMYGDYNV